MSLFQELKRRNVFRVAAAYAVVTWLVLQISDVVLNNITAPGWVFQVLMLFLAVGFPIALLFAWAFEMTPEGLKREREVDRSQSITSQTGRKLDSLVIGVLVVAVGLLLADKFVSSDSSSDSLPVTEVPAAEIAVAISDEMPSIAVLPFVNMSADESSTYFSDGLADTVLHMLAQIRELRVAARTSSFQFRDQTLDIAAIGEQLKVGNVLEGSVQRAGDKIRVTAQLIDVSNGYHLWSGNFDRDLSDVFAIQDEIATEVVAALKLSLLGEVKALVSDQTASLEAYTAYLLGIDNLESTTTDSVERAIAHLTEAIRLDPDYARAYSTLGRAYLRAADFGFMDHTAALAATRKMASRALDIDPESSEALAVLGKAELEDGNRQVAGELLRKAIENGPNDVTALNYYGEYLQRDARPEESVEVYRKLLRLDPLAEIAYSSLAYSLFATGQYAKANEAIATLKAINPDSAVAYFVGSILAAAAGNLADAIAPMKKSTVLDPDDAEGFALMGHYYLSLDMPAEAAVWFDRAAEVGAQNPLSRSAPLFLNYYLRQDDAESVRLARELLQDRIDERFRSRFIALIILIENAAETGNHDSALEVLDNLYPELFDDPPHKFDRSLRATFIVGMALMRSGDVERGTFLLRSYLELREPYNEAYWSNSIVVAAYLALSDKAAALQHLESFAAIKYTDETGLDRLILERSRMYDSIRDEPAFQALLEEYRSNAMQQGQLLQAMNQGAAD